METASWHARKKYPVASVTGLDEKILALYARGMSIRDISARHCQAKGWRLEDRVVYFSKG
jgi:hypothetical protein